MKRDQRIQSLATILLASVLLVVGISLYAGISGENYEREAETAALYGSLAREMERQMFAEADRADSLAREIDSIYSSGTITMADAARLSTGAAIIKNARKNIDGKEAAALARILYEAAGNHGISFAYLLATVEVESRFATGLVSPAGATGLGQLMPRTAGHLAERAGLDYDHSMLYDPEFNAHLSAMYIASLWRMFNSVESVAAAYNSGPGGALRYAAWKSGNLPADSVPEETRNYVVSVMRLYREYVSLML